MSAGPVVHRSAQRLRPDPSRVVIGLFVPGQEGFVGREPRAQSVIRRLLALDEEEVRASLADVMARCGHRHRDLPGALRSHAAVLMDRLDEDAPPLSPERELLLGAVFSNELAVEGAALCNPSIVAHPDQRDVGDGSLRVVLSVRAIGEGHRSSIGFRTGIVDAAGQVLIDPAEPWATTARVEPPEHLDAVVFREALGARGGENIGYVFDHLGARFTPAALEARLVELYAHLATRRRPDALTQRIRAIAERSYRVVFDDAVPMGERVLRPAMSAESHGMEDARFVRFVDEDGSATLCATYTAYDGTAIRQQLLRTEDLRTFTSDPLVGPAARDKGLALFPRRIGGRYAALSRADREVNSVVFADDIQVWEGATPLQRPDQDWGLVQVGNCGSPIETAAGWLVLNHGVGPMRTYRIGALLLDLEDPTVVIGRLPGPLLQPLAEEQDGYVPNVVYSCGALVHADTLVLPYGIGDASIGIATVPLSDLLGAMAG